MEYTNKLFLVEIFDPDLYMNHYSKLYSFSAKKNVDYFWKALAEKNSRISKLISSEKCYNLSTIFQIQNEYANKNEWIIPWIDFVTEDFLSTIFVSQKLNGLIPEKYDYVLTKTFYFFIDEETIVENFYNRIKRQAKGNEEKMSEMLEGTYFFYKNSNFDVPITFCFLLQENSVILKMEMHQYKPVYCHGEPQINETQCFLLVLKSIINYLLENGKFTRSALESVILENLKKYAGFCV